MSGYENVARHMAAAAGTLRPAHKGSTSGLIMSAGSAAELSQAARRRERSWRVLISIGLILPALAAIIGIVAWAISIEVANTGAPSASSFSNSHRKQQPAHVSHNTIHHQHHHHLQPQPQPQQQARLRPEAQARQLRRANEQHQRPAAGPLVLTAMPNKQQPINAASSGAPKITIANGSAQPGDSNYVLLDKKRAANGNSDFDVRPEAPDSDSAPKDEKTATSSSTSTTPEPPQHSSSNDAASDDDDDAATKFDNGKHDNKAAGERQLSDQPLRRLEDEVVEEDKPDLSGHSSSRQDDDDGSESKQAAAPTLRRQRVNSIGDSSEQSNGAAYSGSNESGKDGAMALIKDATTTTTKPPIIQRGKKRSNKQIDDNRGDASAELDDSAGFEAIASAISTSLASSNSQQLTGVPVASSLLSSSPLEGDTGAFSRSAGSGSPTLLDYNQAPVKPIKPAFATRRRTTGEHVADVIDHIVEQRKHSPGQLTNGANNQLSGPQIVVVAPVGANPNMRARSLTRQSGPASGEASKQKESTDMKQTSVAEPKQKPEATSSKKATWSSVSNKKKPILKGKRPLLGARLLNGNADGFSERVEVIEDDDSSTLLLKSPETDSDEDLEGDEMAEDQTAPQPIGGPQRRQQDDESNIHVASNSAEARHRSPRHEISSSRILERYAPLESSGAGIRRYEQPSNGSSQPKLYSAEQLIREHVLKSKAKSSSAASASKPTQQVPAASTQKAQQRGESSTTASASELQNGAATSQPSQQKQQQQQSAINDQVKVIATTVRPSSARARQQQTTTEQTAMTSSRSQQQDAVLPQMEAQQQYQAPTYTPGVHQVQVPLFQLPEVYSQPRNQHPSMNRQQQQPETYQHMATMESQNELRYQRIEQPPQQQQQHHHHHHQQRPQQHQPPQAMPVFADQEFNVPAHMAESVIQDIQRSPSAIGVVNGQPQLYSVMRPQQVPFQYQQQQQQPESGRQLMAAQSQLTNQAAIQLQVPHQQQYQSGQLNQFRRPTVYNSQSAAWNAAPNPHQHANQNHEMLSRLMEAHRRHQVLANRNSVESSSASAPSPPTIQAQFSPSPSSSSSSSSTGARSLVRPVAQMALKHLFSSLGAANSQQAQPGALDQERSMAQQPPQPSDGMPVGASSQLSPSVALPDGANAAPTGDRQMRSLPIAPSERQQQVQVGDQEVQESYGQVPTYPMGGGGGGYGGGGEHYGGGQHYESDHDKKSRGVTFHFGGGPIGGGTQLITSPMGIFKHLMIPLLPNPRVNLNGKVVFGVVLEKSTAFGPPPKKKYKFWGR